MALLYATLLSTWTLIAQTGLNNNNLVKDFYVQSNNTSSAQSISVGSHSEDFLKRVSGDATDEPGLASWLKPLSGPVLDTQTFYWPTGVFLNGQIFPGETFYARLDYNFQTGSQMWEDTSFTSAERGRHWKTYTSYSQFVLP